MYCYHPFLHCIVYINSYALSQIGLKYQNPTNGLDPVSLPMGWVLPRLEDTYRVRTSLLLDNMR